MGSIQAYSDEDGKLVQVLSYDAWGRRRNPANWAYYTNLTDANAIHPRGFTGHEHLDLFEMINMNGRMYDPVVGRFMSPDPYVQAPDYTQGLNRYSYCLNNPLSLVDPSGYSWFSRNWKSLVSAVVGITVTIVSLGSATSVGAIMISGALGGASSGLTGALLNGANIGQIVKSTLTGGLWGAAGGFLAAGSGGGAFLERLFKHSFSQAWLEGIRGGNIKHGFISGLASAAGGSAIGKYGSGLSVAGKVAANAVLTGTVTELGGGKFANGAITGAYEMMFNTLLHQKRQNQQKKIWQQKIDLEGGDDIASQLVEWFAYINQNKGKNPITGNCFHVFELIDSSSIPDKHWFDSLFGAMNGDPVKGVSSVGGQPVRWVVADRAFMRNYPSNYINNIYGDRISDGYFRIRAMFNNETRISLVFFDHETYQTAYNTIFK